MSCLHPKKCVKNWTNLDPKEECAPNVGPNNLYVTYTDTEILNFTQSQVMWAWISYQNSLESHEISLF